MREGRATTASIKCALAALVFAAMMFLSPSLAGAGWSAPVTVSGVGTSTSQTRIAGGTDGVSWVVWKRNVAGLDVIEGTRVQPDGTQGPIVTLSSPLMDATDPVIASRADGSAMVAWLNLSAIDDTVHSRSIAADGSLGPIETRSTVGPVGQPASDISIALGSDGTAGLAWRKFNGTNWVAQGVKVAADGTSGTIHDLSDPAVSVGPPDIGAAPPSVVGQPNSYQVFWPQGSGADSNVGAREIKADDSLSAIYLQFAAGVGGDPFDVQVAYGADGAMNAMWVRYRENTDAATGTKYYNWAVEWIRNNKGVALNPASPTLVNAVSPVVAGVPYNISSMYLTETFGGNPSVAWIHDLNGGGQRVETGRIVPILPIGAAFQAWANPSGDIPSAADPVISSNASAAAVSGWTVPGALPNQGSVFWTRFSNSSFDPFIPSGDFVYSEDLGLAMADSGRTLAAYTGIDGGAIGSTRVQVFEDPGLRVDPGTFNYGKVNVGQGSTRFVTVRGSGQTPVQITGVSLSGADAGQFELSGATGCVKSLAAGSSCQFGVVFTPASTGAKTAQVTVQSDAGNRVVNLNGTGDPRTRNRITAKPGHATVRKGRVVKIRVKATNVGGIASSSTRVCGNLNKRALRLSGNRCRTIGSLAAGATRTLTYRVRVTWRARTGVRFPVIFRMRSGNAVVRQVVVNIRRKGR